MLFYSIEDVKGSFNYNDIAHLTDYLQKITRKVQCTTSHNLLFFYSIMFIIFSEHCINLKKQSLDCELP